MQHLTGLHDYALDLYVVYAKVRVVSQYQLLRRLLCFLLVHVRIVCSQICFYVYVMKILKGFTIVPVPRRGSQVVP